MRLTHQDIGNYASVSRETVTRLLDKFSKAGEIRILDRRTLILKPVLAIKSNFVMTITEISTLLF